MHILILPSWYPTSREDVNGVFFRDQALALREYGHRVGVIAVDMRGYKASAYQGLCSSELNAEIDEGIETYRKRILGALPLIPYGNYFIWKYAANKLLTEYTNKHGWPDIIHAHCSIYAGAVAANWRNRYNTPTVLTEHSTLFARQGYKRWQIRLAENAANTADACIAVSRPFGILLSDLLRSKHGQWFSVPNVVASRFSYSGKRPGNRDRIVRLFNLALMSEKKGQINLLDAFARAFANSDDIELWIGGDGPLREELEKRSRELALTDKVRFLGHLLPDQVPKILEEVDIMVVSSHFETFGVVAAEALMVGIPVVATRCGGPEHFVGKEDGIIVSPKDPVNFAVALKEIVSNLDRYDSSEIAARAQRRFSSNAVASQLNEIYQRVTQKSSKEGRAQ